MSDVLYLGLKAKQLEDSPEYQPISCVKLTIGGEDSNGNPIVCTVGNQTGRTIETNNPLIWDKTVGYTVAQNILSAVQGYAYRPYTADGALLNPVAEIGDAVEVGDVFSVIADVETTFSPLMTASVCAPVGSDIDHEYPYESSENRELMQQIQGLKTSFIVENGRIAAEISDVQETASGLSTKITDLEITVNGINAYTENDIKTIAGQEINSWASFNFTPENISSQVSSYFDASGTAAGYYEDLTGPDGELDQRDATIKAAYETAITQSAKSIEATVAGQESKWDLSGLPSGVSISVYGYGNPSGVVSAGGSNRNKYYLDQTSGKYYKSNGTSWVLQTGQLELITSRLQSALSINANSISSLLTSSSEHGNAISSIEQMIDNITLSVSSDIYGHAKFEIGYWKNDAEGGGGTYAKLDSDEFDVHVNSMNIYGTITASAVAANSTIESPVIYGGLFYGGTQYSPRGALQIGGQSGSYGDLTLYGGSSDFHEVFKVKDYIGSTEFYAQSRLLGTYSYDTNTFYAAAGTTWYFANANVILPS